MYATCLHCQRALGRNELLETLPIGRRIAFDEAAGRLWVVCGACGRWNLVPFEARYEAIEASEKLFRAARLRMSTGQIGLAKTREGTELVRIGAPLRPEMAAWRYAGSLAKRRLRWAMTTAPVTVGLAGVAKAFPMFINVTGPASPWLIGGAVGASLVVRHVDKRKLATLALPDRRLDLSRNVASGIRVDARDPQSLRMLLPTLPVQRSNPSRAWFGHDVRRTIVGGVLAKDDADMDRLQRYVTVSGDLAPLLRTIMPVVNEAGSPPPVLTQATDLLVYYDPDPRQILFGRRKDWSKAKRLTLADVSEPRRLALEMLVHEDSERRWLAGELQALEAEWQRAEEIAAIADGLTRAPAIEARLDALREGRGTTDG